MYSILYIITEINSAVAYEHTVPIGAPEMPNAGFLISRKLTIILTTQPHDMDISGARTLPPASKELFTTSRDEENIIAGLNRHRSIAPASMDDDGNKSERISFEYAISPTSIGDAIYDANFKADSSDSLCSSKSLVAIALVNTGRKAIDIGEIIDRARFSIGTARVV